MNGPLIFCEILASWTIVGAVETSPNWMRIDYLDHNDTADYIVVHRHMYDECFPPVPPTEELQ